MRVFTKSILECRKTEHPQKSILWKYFDGCCCSFVATPPYVQSGGWFWIYIFFSTRNRLESSKSKNVMNIMKKLSEHCSSTQFLAKTSYYENSMTLME